MKKLIAIAALLAFAAASATFAATRVEMKASRTAIRRAPTR